MLPCSPRKDPLGSERESLTDRHQDFQAANIVPEMGTHVHGKTSNDVVTRLSAVESCHCVTLV